MDDYAGVQLYQDGAPVALFSGAPSDTGAALSATYTPATPGYYQWFITVVDNETPPHESVPSDTFGTPLSIPFGETFDVAGEPNPALWINHNADVNDRSNNPPSAPYALNLNGMPFGEDIVELKPLDLSGMAGSGVVFRYSYQPQGNGNAPEPVDSLRVYFKNDLGNWIEVKAYPGTPLAPFVEEVIPLDSVSAGDGTFFYSQFQVRFRSTGGVGNFPNDDWFIDDVFLGPLVRIDEQVSGVPKRFSLEQNYPNPFNPGTKILFALPRASRITLHVFDVTGRQVRKLAEGQFSSGRHQVVWDGRDDAGVPVASGVYFYRLKAGSRFVQTRKMVLLR